MVTIQLVPRATTTIPGRASLRSRAASSFTPSAIWRHPRASTSNPAATSRSTAPSITESPTASGGVPAGFGGRARLPVSQACAAAGRTAAATAKRRHERNELPAPHPGRYSSSPSGAAG